MSTSQQERAELAALLKQVGPEADTLCEGWNARDLATHLYIREHRPDAVPGMFVSALEGHLDRVTKDVEKMPFDELVDAWAKGAPVWNPMKWADRFVNVTENFVHHEDVRRAQAAWEPRQLSPGTQRELWGAINYLGKMLVKNSPVSVVLVRPDGVATTLVDRSASGAETVTLRGEVGELVLWLYGRTARIEAEGNVDLVERTAV